MGGFSFCNNHLKGLFAFITKINTNNEITLVKHSIIQLNVNYAENTIKNRSCVYYSRLKHQKSFYTFLFVFKIAFYYLLYIIIMQKKLFIF